METIFESLINSYGVKSTNQAKLAIREILQNLILIGLSRANFFNYASFYGGTALRIFYGLNRYSEDLDFTLNKQDPSFSLKPFMKSIIDTCATYGLEVNVDIKTKKVNTPIESVFAKLNTYTTFINAKLGDELTKHIHKDELLKVKFEVDCNPSLSFNIENMILKIPDLTLIVVSHKFVKENLNKYDNILAIKDGQLKEVGTFQELINQKGYFYSLFNIIYGEGETMNT